MNAVDTHQKRLHDEIAAVEKEIQSHNQQVAALNQRLEGLKRAVELFESEQSAIVELLRTSTPLGKSLFGDAPIASAATAQNAGGHRNAGQGLDLACRPPKQAIFDLRGFEASMR